MCVSCLLHLILLFIFGFNNLHLQLQPPWMWHCSPLRLSVSVAHISPCRSESEIRYHGINYSSTHTTQLVNITITASTSDKQDHLKHIVFHTLSQFVIDNIVCIYVIYILANQHDKFSRVLTPACVLIANICVHGAVSKLAWRNSRIKMWIYAK